MIPRGVEVFVAVEPIDLRWGFDRLAGCVEERLGRSARGGALFVFFGKRRAALKVLFFDGTGLCLFYKRLDRWQFRVPAALRPDDVSVVVAQHELDDLLDGLAVEARARPTRRPRVSVH